MANRIQDQLLLLRLRRMMEWLFPVLARKDFDSDFIRKKIYISILTLIAAPMLAFFTFVELQNGNIELGAILLFGALLFLAAYVLMRYQIAEGLVSRSALVAIIFILIDVVLQNRYPQETMYLVLIPIISIFAFGLVEGTIWAVSVLLGLIVMFHPATGLELSNMSAAAPDLFASYTAALAFSLAYEAVRLRTQHISDNRSADLQAEHEKLVIAKRELESREQIFRHYADLASDWLIEFDADDTMTFVSYRFEQVTGIKRTDILGRKLFELFREYTEVDGDEILRIVENRDSFKDLRYYVSMPDGERLSVVARGTPVYAEDGSYQGYITASTDLTEYEKVQEEIKDKERTLQHMHKMDAIGQLTSGISHDFNNLMTVIKGNIELLKLGIKDTKDLEAIDAIDIAVSRAAQLNSRLSSFSRQQAENIERINLNSSLSALGELIRRSIGESIELEMIIPDDLHSCHLDPAQLESAVLNLALNGRDAMRGEGRLTIAARNISIESDRELAAGRYVKISVVDEGEGIPPELIARITEPFFTTKPEGEGTGLGLAMVRGFVDRANGRLEIDSAPGIGTSISLLLPATTTAVSESLDTIPADIPPAELPSIPPSKVMVIEDEKSVQTIVSRMLGLMGHKVTICSSAEEALDQLSMADPDLFITDLMLGKGMNGLELADHIRNRQPEAKVILMSGYPEKILGQQIDESFQYFLLRKPFSMEELSHALSTLFD